MVQTTPRPARDSRFKSFLSDVLNDDAISALSCVHWRQATHSCTLSHLDDEKDGGLTRVWMRATKMKGLKP